MKVAGISLRFGLIVYLVLVALGLFALFMHRTAAPIVPRPLTDSKPRALN